jgi:RNA polymerase sigma factor (sigma-70 family)
VSDQPVAFPPANDPARSRWFAEQVQVHDSLLRNWLRRQFPTITDRDDVIQESYLRVWNAYPNERIECVRAYLFTTARNLALNRLRHSRRVPSVGENALSGVLDDKPSIPDKVSRDQELQHLIAALQSLPDRCREVFTLRRIYGLSQKEIAAKLGISEKTVEVHNHKAMKRCIEYFRELDRVPATQSVPPLPSAPTNFNSLGEASHA